jgi:hypothetical protein
MESSERGEGTTRDSPRMPVRDAAVAPTTTATAAVTPKDAELYFLIAKFLASRSETTQSAATLKKELARHEVLGRRTDWRGGSTSATYGDVDARFPSVPDDQLVRVLGGYLEAASRPQALATVDSIVVNPRALDVASASSSSSSPSSSFSSSSSTSAAASLLLPAPGSLGARSAPAPGAERQLAARTEAVRREAVLEERRRLARVHRDTVAALAAKRGELHRARGELRGAAAALAASAASQYDLTGGAPAKNGGGGGGGGGSNAGGGADGEEEEGADPDVVLETPAATAWRRRHNEATRRSFELSRRVDELAAAVAALQERRARIETGRSGGGDGTRVGGYATTLRSALSSLQAGEFAGMISPPPPSSPVRGGASLASLLRSPRPAWQRSLTGLLTATSLRGRRLAGFSKGARSFRGNSGGGGGGLSDDTATSGGGASGSASESSGALPPSALTAVRGGSHGVGGAGGRLLARRYDQGKVLNGHGFHEVYCVTFDQTGRYAVTGADDMIVKVS